MTPSSSVSTRSGIPEVAVNFALSWDARVSSAAGSPANFSSPGDKKRLLAIRASGDAVMVGRRTLEVDRMEMGLPDADLRQERLARRQSEYPLRVIVSGSGALDPGLKVFERPLAPVLLFTSSQISRDALAALEGKATVHIAPAGPENGRNGRVSPRWILETLATRYGVRRLICEGGPGLFRALVEEDLVDEINLTFCPLLFGGTSAATLTGAVDRWPDFLPASREYRLEAMEVINGECFARYRA